MSQKNLQVLLDNRPAGAATESNFRFAESPVPDPKHGEVLVRVDWLSLDPYMRGRMNEGRSYAPRVEIGDVMVGQTIGEVLASKHERFKPGDRVLGNHGWQKFGVSPGEALMKLRPGIPETAYLGAAGAPGITAWYGLLKIGEPQAGETVVVSAAAGAVGGVVGQIAKLKGCRVIGIAGGTDKCDFVVKELGFDACLDYKAGPIDTALKSAAPEGVNVYFDNVGGEILDAVLRRMRPFGRIPLCGLISGYNGADIPMRMVFSILTNRLKIQGFIVTDHMTLWPEAIRELAGWIAEGKIKYRETIAEGLENAPATFLGVLAGKNTGKQLLKIT